MGQDRISERPQRQGSTPLGEVTIDEALPLVRKGVLDAIEGALPVTDRYIPRGQGPSAAGVSLALDPSLR